MNKDIENHLSDYVLRGSLSDILEIEEGRICVLGIGYPIFVNDKGRITKIKDIKLDLETSSGLTYQLWSLNFINSTLQNSKRKTKILEIRKKAITLLIKTLSNLENSKSLQEVFTLLKNVEKERKSLKAEI